MYDIILLLFTVGVGGIQLSVCTVRTDGWQKRPSWTQ